MGLEQYVVHAQVIVENILGTDIVMKRINDMKPVESIALPSTRLSKPW